MYYVVQVKTGKEDKAIKDILEHNSGSSPIDVFSPYREALRKYKGEVRKVKERCFPGYVFVETDDVNTLFIDLYYTPGFTKLLGREEGTYHFVSLSKEESRMIEILYSRNSGRTTEISDIEITEGDTIRILSGPLMDMKGKIKKVNLHKRFVTAEITLFDRVAEVKLGINIITTIR